MKKLVVYYSLNGNTKFIAEQVALETGADMLELKPKTDIAEKGFMRYLWGGREVMTKQTPLLADPGKIAESYEMIFIGTPVWAFSFAPAVRSFFKNVHLENKKIALFCSSGGAKGKTFENMRQELGGNEIVGEKGFVEPLRKDKAAVSEEARKWAREMTVGR